MRRNKLGFPSQFLLVPVFNLHERSIDDLRVFLSTYDKLKLKNDATCEGINWDFLCNFWCGASQCGAKSNVFNPSLGLNNSRFALIFRYIPYIPLARTTFCALGAS